ncbi:hypothetical protein GCM10027521_57340 [Amycolatopsis cihanbeyliensis]
MSCPQVHKTDIDDSSEFVEFSMTAGTLAVLRESERRAGGDRKQAPAGARGTVGVTGVRDVERHTPASLHAYT